MSMLLRHLCILAFLASTAVVAATPRYSIHAIRLADSLGDAVAEMVIGAPPEEKVDDAYVMWLIRGGGHNILFDSGFHRARWFREWPNIRNYLRPDRALRLAGLEPGQVTDVIVSHAHWDHMGGIDLFPRAQIWIQREEYRYYTGPAWQPGGDHEGIDPDDVLELVRANTQGRVHLVEGDDREILPGIRAYTGARHTYASQFLRIKGDPPFVLASDNLYLYRNLDERKPSATFSEADWPANLEQQRRMLDLAGARDRVIPGHDALPFRIYPTQGRVATLAP